MFNNPYAFIFQRAALTTLPPFLARKNAILNVQNLDNRGFGYAILSAMHPPKSGPAYRPSRYNLLFEKHPEIASLSYPIDVENLAEVEQLLKIPINVFSFSDKDGRQRYPLYVSHIDMEKAYDLLYWNGQFAWIKEFHTLHGRHFQE